MDCEVRVERLPIVVVHHGAPDWCRESVAAIEASVGVAADVYVVDNGGHPALAASDLPPSATLVRPGENLGYSGGANAGLRRALAEHPASPWLAIACHDARPGETTLRTLVSVLEDDPTIGIVGPQLRGATNSTGGSWRLGRARNHLPRPDDAHLVERDWVSGCLLVVRRTCLLETGGLDERFGSYVEDVDLCLRARDAGWRVVCSNESFVSTAGSTSPERYRFAARNAMVLVAKRHGAPAAHVVSLRYLARGVRALMSGIAARHRTATRRQESRRWGRANIDAAVGSQTRRLVRAVAADPHGGHTRLHPATSDAKPAQHRGRTSVTR